DVFDAADFDARELHDAFHSGNNIARRFIGFDGKAVFRRINRATRATLEFFTGGALANVAGAEVVKLSRSANANRVEIFSAKDFYPRDDSFPRGKAFLNERGLVHAEAEAILRHRFLELVRRIKALDAGAAASDIWLEHERKADGLRGIHDFGWLIDD